MNTLELVLGANGRPAASGTSGRRSTRQSGRRLSKPIFDKRTGVIDRDVAGYWRDRYDLSYILRATGRNSGRSCAEAPHLRGRHGQLHSTTRLPRGGVPQDREACIRGGDRLRRPASTAGTATHEANPRRDCASPDVRAVDLERLSRRAAGSGHLPVGDTDPPAGAPRQEAAPTCPGTEDSDEDELNRWFRHLHMKVYGTCRDRRVRRQRDLPRLGRLAD